VSRLAPLEPQALAYDKPLCASLDGLTPHAAPRAGALDSAGREALLRHVAFEKGGTFQASHPISPPAARSLEPGRDGGVADWWLGDLVGALMVATVVLLWIAEPRLQWSGKQAGEAGTLLLVLVHRQCRHFRRACSAL
jgi:hypothetical protein